MESDTTEDINTTRTSFFRSHRIVYVVFVLLFIGLIVYHVVSPPTNNRSTFNRQETIVHIADGDSVDKITKDLEAKQIVKYGKVLKILLKVFEFDKQIERGDYLFSNDIPLYKVAYMLARGQHGINQVKITIKEGSSNEEIITLFSDKLSAFRRDEFISDQRARPGYLFPDTYFFYPQVTSREILDRMTSNFNKRLAPFKEDIIKSNHSEKEIIIMASILEKEAKDENDIRIISGILWKRISIGMRLEVDAARETYSTDGLPKHPISNPGLDSIRAAINPVSSSFLFYLHDKNGITRYAKTYDEHKNNITNYLK